MIDKVFLEKRHFGAHWHPEINRARVQQMERRRGKRTIETGRGTNVKSLTQITTERKNEAKGGKQKKTRKDGRTETAKETK